MWLGHGAGRQLPFPRGSSPEEKEAHVLPLSRTPTHAFMAKKPSGGHMDRNSL